MASRECFIMAVIVLMWGTFVIQSLLFQMEVSNVIDKERENMAIEMSKYKQFHIYYNTNGNLTHFTLETEGMPLRNLIISHWGSAFDELGHILNRVPGNYYLYRPLLIFRHRVVKDIGELTVAANIMRDLMLCEYGDSRRLVYDGMHRLDFIENHGRWNYTCRNYKHLCTNREFLNRYCKLFPIQTMATANMRLNVARMFLEKMCLNVRIILLVRDPRGTMQSRKHRDWCPHNPDCDDPAKLCSDLVEDYYAAEGLLRKYPMLFRTVRYEDLSINPYEMTQEILQFFGLPFDPAVEVFLDSHTKVNIGGVSSTYRDSKTAPFHWKQDLAVPEIQYIQQNCKQAMELWGYRQIEDFTNYQNTFDPLILPPPFA